MPVAIRFLFLALLVRPTSAARRHDQSEQRDMSAAEPSAELSIDAALKLEAEEDAQFCNPFSRLRTKRYRFDVQLSDQQCMDGQCLAIELIRDRANPKLILQPGKSWSVTRSDEGLDWEANTVNPALEDEVDSMTAINLRAATITRVPAEAGRPDLLQISWGENKTLELQGGLYYSDRLMQQGLRSTFESNITEVREHGTGGNLGKVGRYGLTGSASAVGALWAWTAVAVHTIHAPEGQGIVMLLGILGTPVALGYGFGAGATLGSVAALRSWSHKRQDYYTSASKKIFDKLECLTEIFQKCGDNVLVPKSMTCPPEPPTAS